MADFTEQGLPHSAADQGAQALMGTTDDEPKKKAKPPSSAVRFNVSGEAINKSALESLGETFDETHRRVMGKCATTVLATMGQCSPRGDPEEDLPPAPWRCPGTVGHVCGATNEQAVTVCRSCKSPSPKSLAPRPEPTGKR